MRSVHSEHESTAKPRESTPQSSGNGEEVRLAREGETYTLIASSFEVDGFDVGGPMAGL
jgi:hypothetical protein